MLRLLSLLFICVSLVSGCKEPIRVIQDQNAPSVNAGIGLTEIKVVETIEGKLIELYRGKVWQLVRHFPSGYIDVIYHQDAESIPTPVVLPLHVRKNFYPMWAAENRAGDLYLVVYDVVKNSPSGRSLSGAQEGLSVYRLSINGSIQPLVEDIPLGGIDTQIYGRARESGIDICGNNKCFSVENNLKVKRWELDFLYEEEFIEVSFSEAHVAAIIRKKYDDRSHGELVEKYTNYALVVFGDHGLVHRREMGNHIPFGLRWSGTNVNYRIANSTDDYINIFLIDFFKMRFRGVQEYGSNNLEGRVAWSQVYYLNGLISLLGGVGPDLGDSAKLYFLDRVKSELSLIANLCEFAYPGFMVKRYSIDRENVLFALHLGRVLDLLSRADFLVEDDRQVLACKESIKHELRTLKRTVEEIHLMPGDGESKMIMRYRYGYPFWADGVNVPYNYISGYISGLLSYKRSVNDIDRATKLIKPILSEDLESGYPELWRYWQGHGDDGWSASDDLSLNSIAYRGNKGSLAHVTYRTMDAHALITIYKAEKGGLSPQLIRHFRALVRDGYLLPSLNEVFANSEGGPIVMSPMVVNRFARSAYAYELQSQIWALDQLAQERVSLE